jgi:hypothetical protein
MIYCPVCSHALNMLIMPASLGIWPVLIITPDYIIYTTTVVVIGKKCTTMLVESTTLPGLGRRL